MHTPPNPSRMPHALSENVGAPDTIHEITSSLRPPLRPRRSTQAAEKPNIIVILADDMGYGDVACYGAKDIRTPHLDKMAAEGMRFTSFYAQPICGPSRAALMTGCYPLRIGEVRIGDHGGSPLPFRGAKMTTWEGGWRVPGSGSRFLDDGPRWPLSTGRKPGRPKERKQDN